MRSVLSCLVFGRVFLRRSSADSFFGASCGIFIELFLSWTTDFSPDGVGRERFNVGSIEYVPTLNVRMCFEPALANGQDHGALVNAEEFRGLFVGDSLVHLFCVLDFSLQCKKHSQA
jgi:hypothetical protein